MRKVPLSGAAQEKDAILNGILLALLGQSLNEHSLLSAPLGQLLNLTGSPLVFTGLFLRLVEQHCAEHRVAHGQRLAVGAI
jgi:hypothetical protein